MGIVLDGLGHDIFDRRGRAVRKCRKQLAHAVGNDRVDDGNDSGGAGDGEIRAACGCAATGGGLGAGTALLLGLVALVLGPRRRD